LGRPFQACGTFDCDGERSQVAVSR
jgi:hypothetical protein